MSSAKELKILEAAHEAFLRHGFKRITMQEIADAAGISRPALYLVYRSKEEVFSDVIRQNMEKNCLAIARELEEIEGTGAQLRRAFQLWATRSFELIQDSPEARELMDSGHDFARDAYEGGYRQFEAILAGLLPKDQELAPDDLARILSSAVRGFKQVATDASELEGMIDQLLRACRL